MNNCCKEVEYKSSLDGTTQKAFACFSDSDEPKPLLVALHEWSSDYKQLNSRIEYHQYCGQKDWHLIHPNFRGPNNNPEATGSEKVIADILDAVNFATNNCNVDKSRIMLLGVSGGGYTALLIAARQPQIWAAVSAWVPIVDLVSWYNQCNKTKRQKYADDITKSCGGAPTPGTKAYNEAIKRSPITYLKPIQGLNIDINAGINDGHTGSVPISHSLRAFNAFAAERDKIPNADIEYFVSNKKTPPHLESSFRHTSYDSKTVLFRRESAKARVTIFDGGHEIIYKPAFDWLDKAISTQNHGEAV